MMTGKEILLLSFSPADILTDGVYYILCGILTLAVLFGIHLMSNVEKAHIGNKISALAIALGIMITLIKKDILPVLIIYPGMVAGIVIGLILAKKVKMIEMPQLVALLNGIGGAASAIVAAFALFSLYYGEDIFGRITASLAVIVGIITLSGSLVAAGKLHKVIDQKPVIFSFHKIIAGIILSILIVAVISSGFYFDIPPTIFLIAIIVFASAFGIIFSVRIGGADMPITISLLNSLSGIAAAIAGFAIKDILLVSVGGIVGASGLFLTQIMCRAMNRRLYDILLGKTTLILKNSKEVEKYWFGRDSDPNDTTIDPADLMRSANRIIIVPGYGMAVAQAQHLVKELAGKLINNGANVKYAVHPVAGRMPGHMDVLLIEAGVPFEDVYEMDDINEEFREADLTIVVGANDILNPAARNAEGTPIYKMPILNVDQCKNILIFNYDLQPGYSGVDNPIYQRSDGVTIVQGDAAETLKEVLKKM
jgi:H+-translocating NAD(P) transhydrogenase subunit beta